MKDEDAKMIVLELDAIRRVLFAIQATAATVTVSLEPELASAVMDTVNKAGAAQVRINVLFETWEKSI